MFSILMAMSVSFACTSGNEPIGLPNCTRVAAYSAASLKAASARPRDWVAVMIRSSSKFFMSCLKPSPLTPTRQDSSTSTSL